MQRFCSELSPQSCTSPVGHANPSAYSTTPIRQHPKIEIAVQKKEKPQWGKRTSHKYIYKKGGEILGCYDFPHSPSTGASFSAAVDLIAQVSLVPLLPGGAAAASCSPLSMRVGEWTPHRIDCFTTVRPTAPAPPAQPIQHHAAALFHKLRLVPLLPGSGGTLGLSHELIIVKIIGLEESLASGFHILWASVHISKKKRRVHFGVHFSKKGTIQFSVPIPIV